MGKRNTLSAVGDFFALFGSAVAASSAVEGGRKPRARDLKALGIDPVQFKNIRQF